MGNGDVPLILQALIYGDAKSVYLSVTVMPIRAVLQMFFPGGSLRAESGGGEYKY